MVYVRDLKPTDELQAWLKIGLYLRKFRTATNIDYYNVVVAKTAISNFDSIRFKASVVSNDTVSGILKLNITEMDSKGGSGVGNLPAEVSYTAFRELRLISRIAFPGRPINPKRPTSAAIGAEAQPYHTTVRVIL